MFIQVLGPCVRPTPTPRLRNGMSLYAVSCGMGVLMIYDEDDEDWMGTLHPSRRTKVVLN